MSNFTVFEGWDIKEDEIVKKVDWINQKEYEKKAENDIINELFSLLKLKGTRVSRTNFKTSDFQVDNIDFEVTVVHTYIPRTSKIENALGEMSKIFGKCHFLYMFLDQDFQPDIRLMGTEDCDNNGSILCIRQDITLYYLKIINKINEKYLQNKSPGQVIILDFRGAPFDSLTLKKGILLLLNKKGYDYTNLIGIVVALPKEINSGILNLPTYFFIENIHYKGPDNEVRKRLLENTKVQTSVSIMPIAILITKKSSKPFSVQNPCINFPSLDEIRKIVTPETIYERFSY